MCMTTNWTKPEFSKNEVHRAGLTLISPVADFDERNRAMYVMNNWRSAHSRPLQTLIVSTRAKAFAVNEEALVARRLKRRTSILAKLERFPTMGLERMQDLGGCRAIMDSVDEVYAVVDRFLSSQHRHKLKGHKDYIREPQKSGYRGVHLMYAYQSDRNSTWNGLRIEIQIRSALQHAWATTVETVGLFTEQSLKSSQGDADWLEFFRLMSAEIAHREGTAPIPGLDQPISEVRAKLHVLNRRLDAEKRLAGYQLTVNNSTEKDKDKTKFTLLVLDTKEGKLQFQDFSDENQATLEYEKQESYFGANLNVDVALVGVDKITQLPRAYPNYFADTSTFISLVKEALA